MEYQFKIKIHGISKPPVWRKVVVPANFTFQRLHDVIQVAFGWEDYHSFEFRDKEYQGDILIALPNEYDFDVKTLDASKVRLSEIFTDDIRELLYVYDFGDDWVHEITMEAISNDKREKAFCLSAKGNCPPEDCGGIGGYEYIKSIFQTAPDSEEADKYREWLGLDSNEIWDTDILNNDIEKINEILSDI